jgi:hypothetical protein
VVAQERQATGATTPLFTGGVGSRWDPSLRSG